MGSTPRRPYAYDPGDILATLQPHGLPPVDTRLDEYWIHLFFRFCSERHRMQVRRNDGVPKTKLSADETMTRSFVGNVYRELDAGSQRVRTVIIAKGDQTHEEICFRIFLFCSFYTMTAWEGLESALGHVPRYSTYEADLPLYETTLHRLSFVERKPIYTSAFQLVPPTPYFGPPHFAASLRFVLSLMKMDLPARLLQCTYASDASGLLRTIPTLGGFLSLNMLCYLNESPHLSFAYRNFASCGPGSHKYLRAMFGPCINSVAMEEAGLVWLLENQWRYWAALGVDPPHAWEIGLRPGMRVLDFENALCWCHRYVHSYLREGWGSLADLPLPRVKPEACMPAWCDEEHVAERSRPVLKADYTAVSEDEEGRWEVEKIVGRRGNRNDRDGLLRVGWKGYPPEEDTYERVSSLREGADEAVDEWLQWEDSVWSTIQTVRDKYVYAIPMH